MCQELFFATPFRPATCSCYFSHEQNLSPFESYDLLDATVTVGDEFGLFSHLGVHKNFQRAEAKKERCVFVLGTTHPEYEAQTPNGNGRSCATS